jgi:hypothetical protein
VGVPLKIFSSPFSFVCVIHQLVNLICFQQALYALHTRVISVSFLLLSPSFVPLFFTVLGGVYGQRSWEARG